MKMAKNVNEREIGVDVLGRLFCLVKKKKR